MGPYSVLLPGYSTNKTDSGHDSYAPLRIEACRGDTLQIALVNELPAAYYQPDTNLHTHGLIVTPTPDKPGPAEIIYFSRYLQEKPKITVFLFPRTCLVRCSQVHAKAA